LFVSGTIKIIRCHVVLVITGGSFILLTCGSCPVWLLTFQHPTPSFETLYTRLSFLQLSIYLSRYVSDDRIDCKVTCSLRTELHSSAVFGIDQVVLTFYVCLKCFQESIVHFSFFGFNIETSSRLHVFVLIFPPLDDLLQLVLNSLVTNPAYHDQLLTTIKTWPSTVYSVPTIIAPIQLQISTGSKSPALKEVFTQCPLFYFYYDWTPLSHI